MTNVAPFPQHQASPATTAGAWVADALTARQAPLLDDRAALQAPRPLSPAEKTGQLMALNPDDTPADRFIRQQLEQQQNRSSRTDTNT